MGSEGVKRVRALQRGLRILECLSFSEAYSTSEVSRRVSLPRATVLRLLETMELHGYVDRQGSESLFRLTAKGAGLGDGMDASVILGLVSGPVLAELGQEIRWPADVFSFERGALIIQESTNARSPLSLDPDRLGGRFPVLSSAAGRAFLAACDPEQRNVVLHNLTQFGDPVEQAHLKDGSYITFLQHAEEKGYAVRHGHESGRKTSSIGVPIVQRGQVWGSLSTRWLDSALELSAAVGQLLPPLQRAALRIGGEIDRLKGASH